MADGGPQAQGGDPSQGMLLDDAAIQHVLAAIHHGHHPLSQPGGPLGVQPQATPAPTAQLPGATAKTPSTAAGVAGAAAPGLVGALSKAGTQAAATGLAPEVGEAANLVGPKMVTAGLSGAAGRTLGSAVPIVGPIVASGAGLGMKAAEGQPITGEDIGSAVGGAAGGIAGGFAGPAAGAAVGAAAGSVVPGIGTAVGAIAGLLVGGAMAYGGSQAGAAVGRAASGGGKRAGAMGKTAAPFGGRYAPGANPFSGVGAPPAPGGGGANP
jgi:hypothetical protein